MPRKDRHLLEAGVPPGVVQLLPGRGETVGAQLTGDDRVRGVMFTGSTEVATLLQRNIASRLTLRVALFRSSLKPAHERDDCRFFSTDRTSRNRCWPRRLTVQVSVVRHCVLCLQDEIADHTLKMLRGAMAECRMGNPGRLTTDIGPVIDSEANIERHIQTMRSKGRQVPGGAGKQRRCREWQSGTFVIRR